MNTGALYIHFPFCKKKCSYCDFYSITTLALKQRFLDSLFREIQQYQEKPVFQAFPFSTLFLGGGTPSLLNGDEMKSLIHRMLSGFSTTDDLEVTCEANPGTLSPQLLFDFLQSGVNRLSIGVQSFDNRELKALTRIHTAEEAVASIKEAKKTGFNNISIDLIFGIPNQSLGSWKKNLEKAIDLGPQHISSYCLTIEPGTPLFEFIQQGALIKCDEELEREMFLMGKEMLESAGFEHYEISNYAIPGFQCHHNLKYWDESPYLSFGPSAHSFDGFKRWWNKADIEAYCKSLEKNELPIQETEILNNQQKKLELILLGLRRRTGIPLSLWKNLSDQAFLKEADSILIKLGGVDKKVKPFESSTSGKLLGLEHDHLFLTTDGLLVYDSICIELSDLISI